MYVQFVSEATGRSERAGGARLKKYGWGGGERGKELSAPTAGAFPQSQKHKHTNTQTYTPRTYEEKDSSASGYGCVLVWPQRRLKMQLREVLLTGMAASCRARKTADGVARGCCCRFFCSPMQQCKSVREPSGAQIKGEKK